MSKKNKTTYSLLIRSEEKGLGILETVMYALVALSLVITVWQFVAQAAHSSPARQVAAVASSAEGI